MVQVIRAPRVSFVFRRYKTTLYSLPSALRCFGDIQLLDAFWMQTTGLKLSKVLQIERGSMWRYFLTISRLECPRMVCKL